ncbi:hypothetical protein GF325_08600 [Candidatus Bathyarchaeota archaeon]|nr:hypothetical protein [Candidatus Bathyarchaeota archaeon]
MMALNTDTMSAGMQLSEDFIALIDKAVAMDFIVKRVVDDDRKNDFYKSMNFTLKFNQILVLYERKVITTNFILPRVQYIFGFKPKEGLCLLVNKKVHKHVLCDGPLADLNDKCMLINGLQFLLVQSDSFKVWSYIPPCPCERPCELDGKAIELRTRLWVEQDEDD